MTYFLHTVRANHNNNKWTATLFSDPLSALLRDSINEM